MTGVEASAALIAVNVLMATVYVYWVMTDEL